MIIVIYIEYRCILSLCYLVNETNGHQRGPNNNTEIIWSDDQLKMVSMTMKHIMIMMIIILISCDNYCDVLQTIWWLLYIPCHNGNNDVHTLWKWLLWLWYRCAYLMIMTIMMYLMIMMSIPYDNGNNDVQLCIPYDNDCYDYDAHT